MTLFLWKQVFPLRPLGLCENSISYQAAKTAPICHPPRVAWLIKPRRQLSGLKERR